MTNTPQQTPNNSASDKIEWGVRIMSGPRPTEPEKRAEDVISRAFKGDMSAVQEFIKNPLETLKNSFIEMLRKIFGDVGSKLDSLKKDIASGAGGVLGAIIPAAAADTLASLEGRGGVRGQEISDADAKKWIKEMENIKEDKNYQTAISFFVEKWLEPHQAVWIVANLHHESGLRTNAVGDGWKAKGIAQWHPDRRKNILNATGINVANAPLEKQLEALWWEITKGDEKATYNAIKDAKTEEEAARQFCLLFERPANKHVQAAKRAAAANKMMANIENWKQIV